MSIECPRCQESLERYGILPSLCYLCGADRTGKQMPKYVDDEHDTSRSKWSDEQMEIEERKWYK
jgi:hypothetical protein